MAFADTRRGRIFWRQDGASSRPGLLLLHPTLSDHSIWDRMVPFLADHFRVIRIDLPGHGASAPMALDIKLADLVDDILTVLNAAGLDRTLVCGLSIGGILALQMAAAAPDRISGVIASLLPEDFEQEPWAERAEQARAVSIEQIVDVHLANCLSAEERGRLAMWLDPLRHAMLSTTLEGYRTCLALHAAADTVQALEDCAVPTAVPLAPHHGRVGPWAQRANVKVAQSAGKIWPMIEAPGELAGAIARLHDSIQPEGLGLDPARNGERVRREVLGDAWVDRSLAARDGWISDYQDYATQVAWHTIWGRKGLDYRTRRLLVLALTAALGRWEEFRFHARLGIERGSLTVQDIKEVSLQTGLYAGVPVSNTAFNEARAIFSKLGISFPKE